MSGPERGRGRSCARARAPGRSRAPPRARAPRSTSHGSPERRVPAPLDAPAAGHAQVAAQDEPVLEAEQEVLPDRLHAVEPLSVETLGQPSPGGPWVGRLHLHPLADEHPQAHGGAVQGVALGHGRRVLGHDFGMSAGSRDSPGRGAGFAGAGAETCRATRGRPMSRAFIGVRWWLGAAFAVVAATSTAIVVSQFSSRSEQEFRSRAEQLAAGNAVLAAGQLRAAIAGGRSGRASPRSRAARASTSSCTTARASSSRTPPRESSPPRCRARRPARSGRRSPAGSRRDEHRRTDGPSSSACRCRRAGRRRWSRSATGQTSPPRSASSATRRCARA